MLKNNLFLSNKISETLQEEPIDFFFVNHCKHIIRLQEEQFVMSKNTEKRLINAGFIDSDSETRQNTLIVDNLSDGFVYAGEVYDNVVVNSNGEIFVEYPRNLYLMYIK